MKHNTQGILSDVEFLQSVERLPKGKQATAESKRFGLVHRALLLRGLFGTATCQASFVKDPQAIQRPLHKTPNLENINPQTYSVNTHYNIITTRHCKIHTIIYYTVVYEVGS